MYPLLEIEVLQMCVMRLVGSAPKEQQCTLAGALTSDMFVT